MIIQALNELEEQIRVKTLVNLKVDGTFLNVLKGCFMKSFEYAVLCYDDSLRNSFFFLAPVIRGICEDFIVLRFLQVKRSEEERDEILLNKARLLIFESVDKQREFFEKHRPFQPVLSVLPKEALHNANFPPTQNIIG